MPSVNVSRKNFDIQYRGSSPLTLNLANAPWLDKILKIYRPSIGSALAVQSFAGAYNGATPGGAVTVLTPGYAYRIVAAVFNGSWDIPDSVLVDTITTTVQNQLPTANAGANSSITLPTNQASLMGTGTDPDAGDTLTYAWIQVSGPNSAVNLPSTNQNVVATGLIVGVYTFDFTVTDSHGGSNTSRRIINVNPASVTYTGPKLYLAAVGDSLTYGGSGVGSTEARSVAPPIEVQRGLLDNNYFGGFDNYGYSGEGITEMINGAIGREDPGFINSGLSKCILLIQIGANGGYGDPVATAARLADFVAARKVKNMYCIFRTTTQPCVNLDIFNAYVRAHWQDMGFVGLSDLQADPRAQDTSNRTYFRTDSQHYTDAMNQLIASIDNPVILRAANLLPSGPLPAITIISPSSQLAGGSITISGTNLLGAQVRFSGSSPATPTVNSDTNITVVVPPSATSGPLSVSTNQGTSNAMSFALAPPISDYATWTGAGVTISPDLHTATCNHDQPNNFGGGYALSREIINISQSVDGEQARVTYRPSSISDMVSVVPINPPGHEPGQIYFGAYSNGNRGWYHGGGSAYPASEGDGSGLREFVFYKDKVDYYYGRAFVVSWPEIVPPQLQLMWIAGANGLPESGPQCFVSNTRLSGVNITRP